MIDKYAPEFEDGGVIEGCENMKKEIFLNKSFPPKSGDIIIVDNGNVKGEELGEYVFAKDGVEKGDYFAYRWAILWIVEKACKVRVENGVKYFKSNFGSWRPEYILNEKILFKIVPSENFEDGGEVENKETYNRWKSLVNMSKSELYDFYHTTEGKMAGLSARQARDKGIDSGRESARWIMKMKDTPVSEWTAAMWKWAKKQISFISRMSGVKGALYDDDGNKTRKHLALLIWGHNPEKKSAGGDIGGTYYHGSPRDLSELKIMPPESGEEKFLGKGIYISNNREVASRYGNVYEVALTEPLRSLPYFDKIPEDELEHIIEVFRASGDSGLDYLADTFEEEMEDGKGVLGKQLIDALEREKVDVNETLVSVGYNAIEAPINKLNQFMGMPDEARNISIIKDGIMKIKKSFADGGSVKKDVTFIDDVLDKLQDYIAHILEMAKEDFIEKMKREPSRYDMELIEWAIKLKLVRSFETYTLPTDKLILVNRKSLRNGNISISCLIERDGKRYDYETESIYAGGYNIQSFHVRYITHTDLPKTNRFVESIKIENKIKGLTKQQQYLKEIALNEEAIAVGTIRLQHNKKLSHDEIADIVREERKGHFDATWDEIVARGADKNFNYSEQEYLQNRKQYLEDCIDSWKMKNIKWVEQNIESNKKSIAQFKKKLEAIKYEDGGRIDGSGVIKKPLDIYIDGSVREAIAELAEMGCSSLIVGGAVRDAVLGNAPKDIDIEVYDIDYTTLESVLKKYGKLSLVGKSFGVIKFSSNEGNEYDFSVPRKESKMGIGHKGFDVFFDRDMLPIDAAERRDFTFNALAYDPILEVVHDYYGGLQDLQDGIIRHTSDKFAEDALRILRAMQFQSRMGFVIAPETMQLMRTMVEDGMMDDLPFERISEEWMKWAVKGIRPSLVFDFIHGTGLGKHFPHIDKLAGVPQDPHWHPEGDVQVHTGFVMDAALDIANRENLQGDERAVLIFAALCHDFAKPDTTQTLLVKSGNGQREAITARGHEKLGGDYAKRFLVSIGIKKSIIEKVVPLVENHLEHVNIDSIIEHKSKLSAVRKLSKRLHPANVKELLYLIEADSSGRPPLPKGMPASGKMLALVAKEADVENAKRAPIIMGRHLIEIGLQPSLEFNKIMKELAVAEENGAYNTVEEGQHYVIKNFIFNGTTRTK